MRVSGLNIKIQPLSIEGGFYIDLRCIIIFPKFKRIKDKKVIQDCRKENCELCGAPANIEPHHIYPVGTGGGDIKENLIQLCTKCHINAHANECKKELLNIVEWREGINIDELILINRRAMGYNV